MPSISILTFLFLLHHQDERILLEDARHVSQAIVAIDSDELLEDGPCYGIARFGQTVQQFAHDVGQEGHTLDRAVAIDHRQLVDRVGLHDVHDFLQAHVDSDGDRGLEVQRRDAVVPPSRVVRKLLDFVNVQEITIDLTSDCVHFQKP